MQAAPLDIHPAYVLASSGSMAYVDTHAACGVPGIAMAWRDTPDTYRLLTVMDRLRGGCVTTAARHEASDDVLRRIREESVAEIGHDREASHLSAMLPGKPVAGLAYLADGRPPADAQRALAQEAVRAARLRGPMREALQACLDHGVPSSVGLLRDYRRAVQYQDKPAGRREVAAEPPPLWQALAWTARNPRLAALVLHPDLRHDLRATPDPMDMIRSRWPGISEAHLRRFRSAREIADRFLTSGPAASRLQLVDTLFTLPADWWPGEDRAEWHALVLLSAAAREVLDQRPLTDLRTLLGPSRGRWAAYRETLFRVGDLRTYAALSDADERLLRAARDAGDPVLSLSGTVMAPLLARAGYVGRGGQHDAAHALLYGDKGLPAVLAVSQDWHGRAAAISAAVQAGGEQAWPPLFEGAFRHRGVEIVALSDRAALEEEGAAGPDRDGVDGLDHCVATRFADYLSGRSHVLSVRWRYPGGAWSRLSTCQVVASRCRDGGTTIAIQEHRGRRNTRPPSEAQEAVVALATAAREARWPMVPESLVPRRSSEADAISEACGYDWQDPEAMANAIRAWEPLLPRWARGLGPDGLYAAMAGRGIVPPRVLDEAA